MTEKCQLIGGLFANLIQFCLAVVCVGTLIVKRQQEVPQRDWLVWFLDVAKQGVGSSFGHFANIYLSMIMASALVSGDECQWYCLTFVTDATFGTVLNLLFLSLFESCVKKNPQQCRGTMTFGDYGHPPQLAIFLPQLCVWLCIVMSSKLLLLGLLTQLIAPLDFVLSIIFEPLRAHPKFELVAVMIVIPTVLNALQFWVTDTFLKRNEVSRFSRLGVDRDFDSDVGQSTSHLDESLLLSEQEDSESNVLPRNKARKALAATSGSERQEDFSGQSSRSKLYRLGDTLLDGDQEAEDSPFSISRAPLSNRQQQQKRHQNESRRKRIQPTSSAAGSSTTPQHWATQATTAVALWWPRIFGPNSSDDAKESTRSAELTSVSSGAPVSGGQRAFSHQYQQVQG